ncbi:MAG: hypothetical protein ACJ8E7_03620 [Sphingomicrobium sp.]
MAQAYSPRARRSASKLFVGASFIFASLLPTAAYAVDLKVVYLATFHNGSLVPTVDTLHLGALQKGDSKIAHSEPTWKNLPEGLEIGIKQPKDVTDIVSAGVWVTPVHFTKGSIFALRATFVRPAGPHDATDIWAVAVGARKGGAPDLGSLARTGVTFQVKGNGARMNAQGVTPLGLTLLPPATSDRVLRTTDPEKFTLDLLVDRVTGTGKATLTIGNDVIVSKPLVLKVFTATTGEPITSVGAAIAIASGQGKRATVQLREFRILIPK